MNDQKLDLIPVTTLNLVKKKNGFERDVKIKQVIDYIVNDIKTNPKLHKQYLSILSRACNLIENSVQKKDHINKFDLLIDIYKVLFNDMQQHEIDILKVNVRDLLDNKSIKKISRKKKVYNYFQGIVINNFF